MIYFLSVLNEEFIKIGFTDQIIEKRILALQTGNPYEIKMIFMVDGSLKQEKEIHRSLKEVFERLKVFNNPVNEWYSGNNPIVKMFICNVRNYGINYALRNINSIFNWDLEVRENEIFTIRHLERSLRNMGFSQNQAKTLISQKKLELMGSFDGDR